jgi:hypothetical protein
VRAAGDRLKAIIHHSQSSFPGKPEPTANGENTDTDAEVDPEAGLRRVADP